jgi:predicted esterase
MFGKKQKTMAPTDEFYILGFSPQKSWCHKMIWYNNVDLSMEKLGHEVEFKTCEKNGKISFELLIPWGSIRPYHPWYEPAIGFNLCFVKAIGEKEKNYYFVKFDKKMQSEQSKRKYITLNFEPPLDHNTFYIQPLRANIKENNPAGIKIAGFSNKDTTNTLVAKIISGENSSVFRKKYIISIPKGDFTKKITFDNARLIPGGYKIFLRANSEIGFEHSISVFPLIELQNYISNLDNMRSSISDGTYNTLLFYIENLEKELNELKYYETSYKIRKRINSIELYLHQINKGTDPLKHKKGVYRRAFQSKIDSTLRPYSIYIPENYYLTKKYPLLVYLHGSGDDDRVLNRTPKIEDNYIILAPNGRGTSNCFATEEAQTDIIESINDVIDNFRIDTSNIILSGFSMGGYGVYRTYYEHPDLFKAVAIISGHPNLAQKWIGRDQINFLEYKNMRFFKNTPMFIYHGRQDMNCPFELTEKLVQKLKQQGHNVTFVVNDTGHGSMTEADRKQYYLWLKGQID